MEMVDLLFKWVMFMIRSFVCIKKCILFLFKDCLNIVIIWYLKLILLYYFAHIPYIIVLSHFLLSVHVFCMVYRRRNPVVVSSETPIHLVEIFSTYPYPRPPEGAWLGQHIIEISIFCGSGIRDSSSLEEQCLRLPLCYCPSDMCQSVPGRGYNFPLFVDIKYIRIFNVGKPIINSEQLFLLPYLGSLKSLCNFIYSPTLILLMCVSPFSLYVQLFHFLFLLVFFL